MDKFITELAKLPEEKQKAIKEGLKNQIIAQAVFVRDEQPTRFVAYIEQEIERADASMLKMVQESSYEGAMLNSISEVFVWNKERKRALERLRDAFLQPQPEQHTEPQRSVPEELTTLEAKKILRRGITAGLLNEDDYQAKQGVTRAQQKEFADLASQVLKISNKWVVFGTLWDIKHLAQVKTTDARPETLMAVRKLFQELGFDMDGKPINKKGKFI